MLNKPTENFTDCTMIHKIDKKNKKEKMCVESQNKNVLNKKNKASKTNQTK